MYYILYTQHTVSKKKNMLLCFPNVRVVVIRTIRLILGRTGVGFLRIDVSTDGAESIACAFTAPLNFTVLRQGEQIMCWIYSTCSGKFIHQSRRSHVTLMHEIRELLVLIIGES